MLSKFSEHAKDFGELIMSQDNLAYVKTHLLSAAALDENALVAALGLLNERQLDFADIFFEHTAVGSMLLDDNIIKGGSFMISGGVGVRALIDERCGFAYSFDLNKQALQEACIAARSISQGHACTRVNVTPDSFKLKPLPLKPLYVADDPINSVSYDDKVKLLQQANELARSSDPHVDQVSISLSQEHRLMLVVNTDGVIAADVKPVVQFAVTAVLKNGERRETGSSSMGGAFLLDEIFKDDAYRKVVLEAIRIANVNMEAVPAPAGAMPVVLGAGWPGVLIHEAVGHGLEADENYTKASAFSDRLGQKVASDACTIVDDGTMPQRRGSQSCDDEGTPTQRTVLIENGILKSYMQDRKSARLMKMQPTGNGRRESFDCTPMPRMTNTFMMPGKYDKQEVISSVDHGIYAVNFSGGQVDITSGRFVFSTSEAYLIEHGKITTPIKGATLIGNGPETMQKVSMVANDLEFDRGMGVCGKGGQSVMVGIGQPTLKVDELTVGGTAS